MALHTADEMAEGFAFTAIFIGENVAPGLLVDNRLMNMHRRTRLALNRLGHEGCIHIMLERCFTDRALEQKYLIGQFNRIAMAQVDFKLSCTFFVDQRIDLKALAFREMIDVVDQFVELVDASNRIALTAANGATGPADRRCERVIRVGVLRTR